MFFTTYIHNICLHNTNDIEDYILEDRESNEDRENEENNENRENFHENEQHGDHDNDGIAKRNYLAASLYEGRI